MTTQTKRLHNAVQSFQSSDQTTDDFMEFAQSIQGVTRQGNGLLWTDIRNIIDSALIVSEWKRVYPTFHSYMFSIDQRLEHYCGLGHEDLNDYDWRTGYDNEVEVNDIVDQYMKENFPIY